MPIKILDFDVGEEKGLVWRKNERKTEKKRKVKNYSDINKVGYSHAN